jgi:selenocysteine lyase/cysteine desulfurase
VSNEANHINIDNHGNGITHWMRRRTEPGRLFRFRPLTDAGGTIFEHEWKDEGSSTKTQQNWGKTNLTSVVKELQRFGVREFQERTQLNATAARRLIKKMENWKIIEPTEPEKTGKTNRNMWKMG